MTSKPKFFEEPDAILEAFIRSVIRGRLAGYHTSPHYACHGPDGDETVPTVDNLCNQSVVVLTYVRGASIAFCENHLPILVNYLWHPIHKQQDTVLQEEDTSLLEEFFSKYQEEK